MSTSTTQLFDGTTIEEALGAAVATMGDDLEIIDAQKIRKRRRFGVRREERFEVTAAPRASSDQEFEDVLRRMVDTVDDRERAASLDLRTNTGATVDLRSSGGGVDLADSDLSWWEGAEFVVPQVPEPAPVHDVEIDVRTPPSVVDRELFGHEPADAPATTGIDVTMDAPAVAPPAEPSFEEIPAPAPAPAQVFPTAPAAVAPVEPPVASAPATPDAPIQSATPAGVVWSDEALAELGVPALVRERVAHRSPSADLEWVAALSGAIAEIAAEFETGASSIELTGHGRHAAVDLIVGLCRGMRVGDMIVDGVRVPATPVELALGVRARLQG